MLSGPNNCYFNCLSGYGDFQESTAGINLPHTLSGLFITNHDTKRNSVEFVCDIYISNRAYINGTEAMMCN